MPSKKFMKKIQLSVLSTFCLVACAVSASTSWASTGSATFNAGGRIYSGLYSTADKLISVDIDGLIYKGHYASNAEDSGGASPGVPSGKWGRAFLFASSAQVLRCELDAGFPKFSGQCQGTDGRQFKLKLGAQHKTASTPQRSMTKQGAVIK